MEMAPILPCISQSWFLSVQSPSYLTAVAKSAVELDLDEGLGVTTDLIGRILRRWEDEVTTGVGTRESKNSMWKDARQNQRLHWWQRWLRRSVGQKYGDANMDFGFGCTREFRGCVTMVKDKTMPTV